MTVVGATGRLAGIARHAFPRASMEVLDHVHVSVEGGLAGDFRGAVKPGGKARRQVSLIERADWDAAMAELGVDHHWSVRRANLLVEGLDLPQQAGAIVRIGDAVVLEIMIECDPCSRMEEIEPGLKAALTPDWRGGALARVISGGDIRIGDSIRVEK
jgi:MOSC domain-containing protein YiiM